MVVAILSFDVLFGELFHHNYMQFKALLLHILMNHALNFLILSFLFFASPSENKLDSL